MPQRASHKTRGGDKNSADKNTMNPPSRGGGRRRSQTPGPSEQDPKRRVGQFGGEGEPPLMKK